VNYFIKREIQEYGPYSLAELQRSVASGNILLTDLCRREGMEHWLLVSQLIGNMAVPAAAPAPVAVAAMQPSPYPPPPSLHWVIVLLLSTLTCGLFGCAWMIVEAIWVKKVQPSSKALLYLWPAFVLLIAGGILDASPDENLQTLGAIPNIGGGVLWIVASFSMKSSIEEHYNVTEPLGLTLSGVMTFFFNVYYFQYHFTRIIELKREPGTNCLR
jgi:GYF domain 2